MLESFNFTTRIKNQYATTVVISQMSNPSPVSQEASFLFLIPDDALITNMTMTLNDKEHVAKLKEKLRAQNIFEKAKEENRSAILLSVDFTRRNEVKMATNLQAFQKVGFSLSYEEYIPMRNGTYSHTLKMVSEVSVEEIVALFIISKQEKIITDISVPNLGCKKNTTYITPKKKAASANITSSLYCQSQNTGADGRIYQNFSIQYAFKDKSTYQLVSDKSYFAYFFGPDLLTTFPKSIALVIDVSGSMRGERLQQLQDNLIAIIDSLSENDRFLLITFHSKIAYWPTSASFCAATNAIKKDAIAYVHKLRANGMTNINDALLAGIEALNREKKSGRLKPNTKQFIYFLTDGGATEGVTDNGQILANVWSVNKKNRFPVHGLAFGSDADFDLIEQVSQQTQGKAVR